MLAGQRITATPTTFTRNDLGWAGGIDQVFDAHDGHRTLTITTDDMRTLVIAENTPDWELTAEPAPVIGVGTCVRTLTHKYRGVVTEVHSRCPQGAGWLAGQQVPIRAEALEPGYQWVSILVDGGGSVVAPLYDVRTVANFTVENLWLDDYVTRTEDGTYLPV